jgi:apolipoprotein D and lipocalin family protein
MLIKALIFLTLISACVSESAWGQCPVTYKEGAEFRLNDYLGKWYEIARHKTIPFQKGECTTAEYSLNAAGNVAVHNKEKLGGSGYSDISAEGYKTDDPFRFKIDFGKSFWSKYFKGDYRVVNTDYKNYTIVYSCSDYFFGKFYFAWILSRTPELSQVHLDNILAELETKYDISKAEMHFTDQSLENCGEH